MSALLMRSGLPATSVTGGTSRRDGVAGQHAPPVCLGLVSFLSERELHRALPDALPDPSARLVCELFRLQLPADVAIMLQDTGDPTSDRILHWLSDSPAALQDTDVALLRHAQALIWLEVALVRELAFATGLLSSGLSYWEVALDLWGKVLKMDRFWSALADRVTTGSESATDVERLRQDLPLWLAELVGRFVRAYGQSEEHVACHRLLTVLRRSPLKPDVQEAATQAALKAGYY
jgi:hypothetical protein